MPKKENTKAVEARARKEAAADSKRSAAEKAAEDARWQDEGKQTKAAKSKEEQERKKAEQAAKRAELKKLEEMEAQEMAKISAKKAAGSAGKAGAGASKAGGSGGKPGTATKVTHAELEKQREKEQKEREVAEAVRRRQAAREKGEEEYAKSLDSMTNTNRMETVVDARNLEEAVAQLRLMEGEPGATPVDKHPEKRMKAAYKVRRNENDMT